MNDGVYFFIGFAGGVVVAPVVILGVIILIDWLQPRTRHFRRESNGVVVQFPRRNVSA